MRVLYGVQRYGESVPGGAETACRDFAEHMAGRGHHVEVITSCARDYVTWGDEFEPGTTELSDVRVHRLPVRSERRNSQFQPISSRVLGGRTPLPVERDWLRVQGPDLPGLAPWLHRHAPTFDVAIFYTYLYPTTAIGLREAAIGTATVMHPAAHDEPLLELPVFDDVFAAAGGLALHTPEELATIRRRFRFDRPVEVVGLGLDTSRPPGDGGRFRERYGLGDTPVLLYVGRVEPGKATDELAGFFAEFRRRHETDVKLVVLGALVDNPLDHPDIIYTDYVDEVTRHDAYEAATIFVMPSYFESFSISLCEAWLAGKPALVQGECAVLVGQVTRARGGIPYRGLAEFDAALTRLLASPRERDALGRAGREYAVGSFGWGAVLDRYEDLVARVVWQRERALATLERPRSHYQTDQSSFVISESASFGSDLG